MLFHFNLAALLYLAQEGNSSRQSRLTLTYTRNPNRSVFVFVFEIGITNPTQPSPFAKGTVKI